MPEYSSTTITPSDSVQVPMMNGSTPGNATLASLKAYYLAALGQASGIASLDANGKLTSTEIPDDLDDVLVYAAYANYPAAGEEGKLYIAKSEGTAHYWSGSAYVQINTPLSQSILSGDTTHAPSSKTVNEALALKQDVSNLVTSFQVSPDDTHYPSEKLVHDTTSALSGQIANLNFGETEASEDVVFEGDQASTWAEQTFPSIPTESNDGIFLCKADSAPSTSTDTGIVGQYFADTDYLYICIATNTWRRVALTTF